MIRSIVAIDNKRGIASDHGIPWQGKIPTDVKYYRDKIKAGKIIMGYGLYKELSHPYPGGVNFVATHKINVLRDGFQAVSDARQFILDAKEDIWVLGGAGLYASTIDLTDEIYVTQLDKDFDCTKFFPEFHHKFTLENESKPITENGINIVFQKWRRKQ